MIMAHLVQRNLGAPVNENAPHSLIAWFSVLTGHGNLGALSAREESKSRPDFSDSDAYQVSIVLPGEIQDPRFLRFLEQARHEGLALFSLHDLLVLDLVHREQPIPEELKPRVPLLVDNGIVEPAGRGRHMLSRRLYGFLGKKGVYTRKRGLDRETNKMLLLKHIEDSSPGGAELKELLQVLPALSEDQVKKLIQELKFEKRIHLTGRAKRSRWHLGPASNQDAA